MNAAVFGLVLFALVQLRHAADDGPFRNRVRAILNAMKADWNALPAAQRDVAVQFARNLATELGVNPDGRLALLRGYLEA